MKSFTCFFSGVATITRNLIMMQLFNALFLILIFFTLSVNSHASGKNVYLNDKEFQAFIEISDQMRMGIFFDNGWRSIKTSDRISEIGSEVRYVKLPHQIQQEFKSCFSGENCPKSIGANWKVEIDTKDTSDIYAIQLSNKYVVVSKKTYPYYEFSFIDIATRQVHNLGKFDRILAFSSEFSGVFYSDRRVLDQDCTVMFYSLDGKKSFLPIKISGHIEDMRVVGEKLQLLVKRDAKVRASLTDRIIGVMGHPNSYYTWSLAEVSLNDLSIQEHSFEGKSTNSWGRFICKWCYRE